MTRHLIGITNMEAQRSIQLIDKFFVIASDLVIYFLFLFSDKKKSDI